jgi:hypothetical protein
MKHFTNIIDPDLIKSALDGIRRYNSISSIGFEKLANFGWYIDAEFTLGESTGMMEKALNENKRSIDEYFVKYYNSTIKRKAERISKKHVDRAPIIIEALECHVSKKYFASTSLFLSQADGICNGLLFRIRKDKEALKEYISENNQNSFFLELMSSIENKNTIDSMYSENNKSEAQLNRHGVMHGWDTDFGTQTNSLKAFSLMCFVSDFVNRYKKL